MDGYALLKIMQFYYVKYSSYPLECTPAVMSHSIMTLLHSMFLKLMEGLLNPNCEAIRINTRWLQRQGGCPRVAGQSIVVAVTLVQIIITFIPSKHTRYTI